MAERTELAFDSQGESCAAYLYRPRAATAPVPCVVMAPGFSATRDDGLPAYAERFAAAGLAVLLFDYRHFGASGGQPRQLLDVRRQQADYHAAVACARDLDGIDPDRIVLWGVSFSGGHVVAVAFRDSRIAAVIAQVPFSDGLASTLSLPPVTSLRLVAASLRDLLAELRGRPRHLVAAIGHRGQTAAIVDPEAEPGMRALVAEDTRWRNEVTARALLTLPLYRPVRYAERLGMPLLVCVADADGITPPKPSIRMATRAPRGELRRYRTGHFGLYQGEGFEETISDQIAFLRRHGLAGG